jgi:hypothetical protein
LVTREEIVTFKLSASQGDKNVENWLRNAVPSEEDITGLLYESRLQLEITRLVNTCVEIAPQIPSSE